MKKVLLGTTALVAAGAFAGIGAAQAQDMMVGMQPVEMGGYYTIALVALDADGDTNDRGHVLQQNIELEARAIAELDNGITAGIRVRVNGNNGAGDDDDGNATDLDNISESEVFFTGSFGALHVGMIEAASQTMTIWAPGGNVPIGGVKSAWFGNSLAGWTTGAFMDEDSTKIVYFSPSFNGISFGISYAPEDTNYSYASASDADSTLDPDTFANQAALDAGLEGLTFADVTAKHGEQITAALGYTTEVMGGSISAMIGYETHSTESAVVTVGEGDDAEKVTIPCQGSLLTCDPTAMRYGLTVSIDQIAIGGAINDQEGTGNMGADRTMTDFGIAWSEGPLGLGLQHATDDKDDYDETAIMVNYNLGGGVDVGLKAGSGSSKKKDFTQILLGTMFNF